MDNFKELMDYIVNKESNKTVGIVCKRFELAMGTKQSLSAQEVDQLKAQVKELLHEEFRNIRDFIQTGKIVLDFKTKKE